MHVCVCVSVSMHFMHLLVVRAIWMSMGLCSYSGCLYSSNCVNNNIERFELFCVDEIQRHVYKSS